MSLWGMLYKPSRHYSHSPTIFLVPFPTSVTLEEWKRNQVSYEKIPLLRNIAEKSEYIKTAHQNTIGQRGAPYKIETNPLRSNEEIFVQTDDPESLKAFAKLYTQEAQNKTINLSPKEMSHLIQSNLIDYLQMPRPKTNIQEKLNNETTIFLVPFPESENLVQWKAKNSSYDRIPLLRKIAEKSEVIKTIHQQSLGEPGAFYDDSKEKGRMADDEEIYIKTDHLEGLKALAQLYTEENQGKTIDLSAHQVIQLAGSNLIDYLDMPEQKNDLGELLINTVKNNPIGSVGAFYKLHEDEILDTNTVKDLICDLIKTKKIDSELLSSYSAHLQNVSTRIFNRHAMNQQFAKEGIFREDLLFFDGNIRIYGIITTAFKLYHIYTKFVIVDKNDNRQEIAMKKNFLGQEIHTCQAGQQQ
jgi:hypothetical protein